ncbi:MAG: mechanosensitive ion channel family protein [Gammaproteobacteria bacterium]|nr:mechanosensitive ion channel family protein [Gammaproteobacteria bacterium]
MEIDIKELLAWVGEIPGGWGLASQVFTIVFIALVLDFIQRVVIRKMISKAERTRNTWDDAMLDAMRAPLSLLIWLAGITMGAEMVAKQTEAVIYDYIDPVRDIGVIMLMTWFLWRLVGRIADNVLKKNREEDANFDQTTVDAISKLLRASILITAVLVAMQTLGYSISGILAFGGVGGIAVGFAARDMLANFFGGMTVYMDKPFKVGDWIRSPDREIEGDVEHIGWRVTRIRTFDKRPIYVPNSVFTTITVENPSRMLHRRIKETVGVRYDDFNKVEKILSDIREMIKSHDGIAQDQTTIINFNSFGASSLDILVYCFTKTTVWTEYHKQKEDVLLKIGQIIEENGAEIAFPTRTLHIPDGLETRSGAGESKGE